jgi:hypothetical protein
MSSLRRSPIGTRRSPFAVLLVAAIALPSPARPRHRLRTRPPRSRPLRRLLRRRPQRRSDRLERRGGRSGHFVRAALRPKLRSRANGSTRVNVCAWAQFERRPVHIPGIAPGAICKVTHRCTLFGPRVRRSPDPGSGPVFPGGRRRLGQPSDRRNRLPPGRTEHRLPGDPCSASGRRGRPSASAFPARHWARTRCTWQDSSLATPRPCSCRCIAERTSTRASTST